MRSFGTSVSRPAIQTRSGQVLCLVRILCAVTASIQRSSAVLHLSGFALPHHPSPPDARCKASFRLATPLPPPRSLDVAPSTWIFHPPIPKLLLLHAACRSRRRAVYRLLTRLWGVASGPSGNEKDVRVLLGVASRWSGCHSRMPPPAPRWGVPTAGAGWKCVGGLCARFPALQFGSRGRILFN
jgi:hypothetical protein